MTVDFKNFKPLNGFNPISFLSPRIRQELVKQAHVMAWTNIVSKYGQHLYYGGSFAFNDFDKNSDIDFVCRASDVPLQELRTTAGCELYCLVNGYSNDYGDINTAWLIDLGGVDIQLCAKDNLARYFKACEYFVDQGISKTERSKKSNWDQVYRRIGDIEDNLNNIKKEQRLMII